MENYSYFTIKYPGYNLTLSQISQAYFFTRENNSNLLSDKFFFFFENILPLVHQEGEYLLFLFPLAPYREEVSERELSHFYSLWVSRLEEKLSSLPYSQFIYTYGLEPGYIQTAERVSASLI